MLYNDRGFIIFYQSLGSHSLNYQINLKFNKVTIVGIGLLGGSLARDLAKYQLCETIVGVCQSDHTAQQALDANVVDQVLPIEQAVIGADLIVFATPMQVMMPLLEKINSVISNDTIITDVGSVKNSLYQQIEARFPERLKQFVLAHPIAGGEQSGVEASKLGLFANKHVIITKTPEVNSDYVSLVSQLWTTLGASVVTMSLAEHDAIFAKTSHLPHVIAFSLVNYLNLQKDRDRLFEMAAAGFYDFTRIASSNAHMWRDICVTNRDQLLLALDGFREHLSEIRDYVAQSDQQGIYDYFDAAKNVRDDGLDKKKRSKK